MFEYKKLEEAKHFYNEMNKNKGDQKLFEFNLSACLSAARSVLQYSLEEVKNNGQQKWYDNYIKSSSYIKFFKDKRDINIHKKPVKTISLQEVSIVSTVSLSLSWEIRDKNGNLKSSSKNSQKEGVIEDQDKISYRTIYIFDDWKGSEEAIELSKKYLNELDSFIKEGIRLKFITG